MKRSLLHFSAGLSLLSSGAVFGFFYAWVCSTMWGLDAADPRIAIQAMQAMNASVRNGVFAIGFFGTPVFLLITAALAWLFHQRRAACAFAGAGAVYIAGAFLPTALVNVPMNEALGALSAPESQSEAAAVWSAYSAKWQLWNQIRTVFSGAALLAAGLGVFLLGGGQKRSAAPAP